MDNIQQFARECADFFKDKMFTTDVEPEVVGRRMDAAIYLMVQHVLSGAPRGTNIEYLVMGTKGGGGPHRLADLLRCLRNQNLGPDFYESMPS